MGVVLLCYVMLLLLLNLSITKGSWLGKVFRDPTVADRLGKTSVGCKEETGFTQNNDKYVWRRDNPARFITDYRARFLVANFNLLVSLASVKSV